VIKGIIEKELNQMRLLKQNDESRFNESQNAETFDQENFINTLSEGFS